MTFSRPDRERAFLVAMSVVVVLAAFATGVAAAEQTRTGGTVVVEEGETVEDDLTAMGGTIIVDGTVEGDLSVVGGNVVVGETGTVTGDVDGASGSVRIEGDVGGTVSVGAGTLFVGPDAVIAGDLNAGAGSIDIAGTVGGDVEVGTETLVLQETAVIEGDLRYGAEEFVDEGATVEGEIIQTDAGFDPVPTPPGWMLTVYGFLVNLLLGVLLLLVFPVASNGIATEARSEPIFVGAIGLVVLVAVPLVLVLLVLTLIGIPLAIVGAILFALLLWIASIYGRFAVGSWLLSYTEIDNRWLALLVGLLAVGIVELVPFLGGLITFLVLLLGLGALALVVRGAYRRRRRRRAAGGVD